MIRVGYFGLLSVSKQSLFTMFDQQIRVRQPGLSRGGGQADWMQQQLAEVAYLDSPQVYSPQVYSPQVYSPQWGYDRLRVKNLVIFQHPPSYRPSGASRFQ
jgi:hypothetical protein